MWKLLRRRPRAGRVARPGPDDWKRDILATMSPAELADIGLKPADAERLLTRR